MSLYGFIRTYEELRRSQLRGQVLLGLEFRVWGRFGGEAWRTRNIPDHRKDLKRKPQDKAYLNISNGRMHPFEEGETGVGGGVLLV